jgi:hypothetical protein
MTQASLIPTRSPIPCNLFCYGSPIVQLKDKQALVTGSTVETTEETAAVVAFRLQSPLLDHQRNRAARRWRRGTVDSLKVRVAMGAELTGEIRRQVEMPEFNSRRKAQKRTPRKSDLTNRSVCETIRGIRLSLEQANRGEGRSMRIVIEELAAQRGLLLKRRINTPLKVVEPEIVSED